MSRTHTPHTASQPTLTPHSNANTMTHRLRHLIPLALSSIALLVGCGRVVGAECIEGYDLCGEVCCPSGACSPDGLCTATDAGPLGDGGPFGDGGPSLDDGGQDMDAGERPDGSLPDGFLPDMGQPGCDIGTSECADECVNLDFDNQNCGACGVECAPDELCAFGTCEGTCDAPLVECDGVCVDPSSDPFNCGACGNVCASAICRPTGCTDTAASDVILIGHSFDESSIAASIVVGNGALLRLEDPVRIVVYDGTVSTPNRNRIIGAIDTIATEAGRAYELVPASAAQVPTRLQRADTFLVMPQQGATTDAQLRALGRDWALAMSSFLEQGGAIVVLDGSGDHAGTWQILAESNLLAADGRVEVPEDTVLNNIVPTDALANEVPLSYAAPRGTVAFTGVLDGEVVTTAIEGEELPVAVHRFLAAPEPRP